MLLSGHLLLTLDVNEVALEVYYGGRGSLVVADFLGHLASKPNRLSEKH